LRTGLLVNIKQDVPTNFNVGGGLLNWSSRRTSDLFIVHICFTIQTEFFKKQKVYEYLLRPPANPGKPAKVASEMVTVVV